MPQYLTPGVYVTETASGARPIQPVGTSTAAFCGRAERGDVDAYQPVEINNYAQFVRRYVTDPDAPPDQKAPDATHLHCAVRGFFENGGSRCYVVNMTEPELGRALTALEAVDEVAMVAAPGHYDYASTTALLDHCARLQDRVAILDGPPLVGETRQLTERGADRPAGRRRAATRGGDETDAAPAANPGRPADGPLDANEKLAPSAGNFGPNREPKGYGAYYYPWLRVHDPLQSGRRLFVPPSGHIAGIYSRTDAQRGVHKAPANEPVFGALGLSDQISMQQQAALNPEGVNAIRGFSDGIKVWGARTVAPPSEWTYVNVRRLFNMIKESIAQSTRWIVFEPNNEDLWQAITRDITAFLTVVWRDGALMGSTPEQAFFVKCDAETNPPELIDQGRVVTQIGIAPVKPAEFIVFELGQFAGGTAIQEEEN